MVMAELESIPSKLRLSTKGLQQVDARLKQLGWRKQSPCWAEVAKVAVITLKRFRGRERLTTDSFQAICRALDLDWRSLSESGYPQRQQDPQPPPSPTETGFELGEKWVHRDVIFPALVERLQQGCRVLVIMGIAGVGKTVLAEQLSRHRQPTVGRAVALNFEVRGNVGFVDTAIHCLEQAGQRVNPTERQDPQQIMHRWLALLVHEPQWVVMDSLEVLLVGDEEQGWSVFKDPLWAEFFHQLLGWESCQSQIIVTSQDLPAQIQMAGLRYRQAFYTERLSGLSVPLQAQLFARYGFESGDALAWQYLTRIGAAYEGHPLALQVIIGEILDCYDGDVRRYWQRYGHEIKAAEAQQPSGPEPALRLDRYSRTLRRTVRKRIEDAFIRLRQDLPEAYLLLCLAATYREPVTEPFLLSTLRRRDCPEQRCQVALDTLLDRNLLEIGPQQRLRQHNLIRSVALDHLQSLN
ncbi:MAG: hypothetical protein HC812_09650 [Leptolyngbya sp. RL_3_1]|nr:hypothetical protein [Leptolyngbya sp. RL_3_1]